MIRMLQWVLGISAGLGLILGIIFKLARVVVLNVGSVTFRNLTVTCCLASIALSLIELSNKVGTSSDKE